MKILVVDDDKNCCDDLVKFLIRIDHNVSKAYNGDEALKIAVNDTFDLIISDVNMPELNGIDLVKKLKEKSVLSEIILISGISEVAQSINAIELGIYDFITKPVDVKSLVEIIDKLESIKYKSNPKEYILDIIQNIDKDEIINLNNIEIKDACINSNINMEETCVFSDSMKNIYKKLNKLHDYPDIPILIEGETGTGKEIIAKYVHFESKFNNEPFVAVNCAAINKEMFESELFGYEKGAFTGASPEGRKGFIKYSEKGTLFLDEISELSLETQTKLLRVLQEKEYYKVGSSKKETANSRFIFATNMNLESLVSRKRFREDLFFRLNTCKILIPSLINRKDEIIPLTFYFIKIESIKMGKKINKITSGALRKLYNYHWPGNVRELKNIITNLLLFKDNDLIDEKDIGLSYESYNKSDNSGNNWKATVIDAELPDKPFSLDDHIKNVIDRAIEKFDGNKTKAAEYLGISRMQLYNRYKSDK